LRKCINNSPTDAEELLIGRVVKPTTPQARSSLLESLDELAKAMKDNSKQPLPEEAALTSRSKPLMAPLLLNLFSTISRYCDCKCAKPHRAMLLLFTHRSIPKNTDSHSFTMLLSRGKPGNHWQETGVTVKEQT